MDESSSRKRKRTVIVFSALFDVFVSINFLLLLSSFCLKHAILCASRSEHAKERDPKRPRMMWSEFMDFLTDAQFRRMFRMPKGCFNLLCEKILDAVGEDVFMSESYLAELSGKTKSMHAAHAKTSGGYLCGEVKLAVMLRLMAGGSYIDISMIYMLGYSHTYHVLHTVIQEWINNDDVISFLGEEYLTNKNEMKKVATRFKEGGSHCGIFSGVLGALDGWLVRIRCPSFLRDNIKEPAGFFTRKGFYAINVQAIVDRHKRILWRSIMCRGAEHDSTAFKRSSFYEKLMTMAEELLLEGFYFVGDSAYALRSFLLVPYDGATPFSDEDTFNYHLSSCRIWIECAFGEIDMRWGIFWRPLGFSLYNNIQIIDGAMRLHNFIVEYRLENPEEFGIRAKQQDLDDYQAESDLYQIDNPDDNMGVFSNGRNEGVRYELGRPTLQDAENREMGSDLRDKLKDQMRDLNLTRVGRDREWYRSRHNRVVESS